jgi:HEPN domain-containing protein
MAADLPRPDPRVITAYLDDVALELEAAKRLVVDPPNRFAAFHLQQAAEKLIKAVRLIHGLRVTAEHNLEVLVNEIPDDGWRTKLAVMEPLSSFATTYRYPSPTGKTQSGPSKIEILSWVEKLRELCTDARTLLTRQSG